MKRNPGSKQKGSARRGSKQPSSGGLIPFAGSSSGALIPFAGSSSGALVPFAVPAAAAAVVQRLGDDDATAASAAATLYGDGDQVVVAATLVAATPSAAALTFHESEDEAHEAAPVRTIHSAPQKRKKARSVRATAPAAAAAAAQPEVAYAVERCWRDQQCKNCKSVIPEGSLRLLRIRSKGGTRASKLSVHLGCSRPTVLSSVEELRGFEALELLDAERVRAWFGGSDTGASPATLSLVGGPPLPPPANGRETEFARRDRLRSSKRRNREGGRKQWNFAHDQHVTPWPSLRWHTLPGDGAHAGDSAGGPIAVRPLHSRNLMALLQREMHARRTGAACGVLATLLRETVQLTAPLAQVGITRLRHYAMHHVRHCAMHHATH